MASEVVITLSTVQRAAELLLETVGDPRRSALRRVPPARGPDDRPAPGCVRAGGGRDEHRRRSAPADLVLLADEDRYARGRRWSYAGRGTSPITRSTSDPTFRT